MDTTTYSTSFVNVCSSEQSHIVHERIFPVPFTVQTFKHCIQINTIGPTAVVNTWTRDTKASMCTQLMPIAVLLRRHAATVIGKWFVLSRLLRLPTHIRWCFAAVSYLCCVIVSCLCNLLTRPRRFKATSQDEKQEINLLWLTMIW